MISGRSPELKKLDSKCYDMMQMAHRPSTRRNKRSHATLYQRFCDNHNLTEMPADEWQLCRYAMYTAERVSAHGTVQNYINGIRNLHQLAGYKAPEANSPTLKLIMDGIKAYLAKPVRQAEPIGLPILKEISQFVNFKDGFQMCAYAASLTGFYLLLRSSNLVPTSTNKFNRYEQFTRWHVGIDEDDKLAVFLVEWSKTIQHCRKELWVPVVPGEEANVCLIQVLKSYFKLVPAEPTDPCFCYRNGKNVLKALTYEQLSEQLQDWIECTGRDPAPYSLHGLRRAGTSHAFESNLRPEYIRLMGDWGSDCFFRYLDVALDHQDHDQLYGSARKVVIACF